MRRALTALALSVGLSVSAASDALSQHHSHTFRYPRVYGATGRPYGPTQAHYQYQRQYGRPWHGYGGLSVNVGRNFSFQLGSGGYGLHAYSHAPYGYGYPYYSGGYGLGYGGAVGLPGPFGVMQQGDYGPLYSYIPMAPQVIQAHPQFIGPNPFDNSVLNDARIENEQRWGKELIIEPQPKTVERQIIESSPAAQLKSLRAQSQGDEWFRKGDYSRAYARYKVAVDEADDRAAAHFRLAYSLVALGRYDRAVAEMKRGLRIDPTWPVTGDSLTLLFGADNRLAKTSIVSQVTAWVRDDIRDPDRLFLLGVLLHFDDDDRAGEIFETALRLAGSGDHLVAFLQPTKVEEAGAGQPVPQVQPEPQEDAPQLELPQLPEPPRPKSQPRPVDDGGPVLPPLPSP